VWTHAYARSCATTLGTLVTGKSFFLLFRKGGVRGCHPSTRQTECVISPRVCQSITGVDISYLPGESGGVEGDVAASVSGDEKANVVPTAQEFVDRIHSALHDNYLCMSRCSSLVRLISRRCDVWKGT
jgi:hypothetical protein